MKLAHADGKKALAGLASAVALADWDRDGKVDLVVGNIDGEVWFLPNTTKNGRLSFGEKQPVVAGGTEIGVGGDAGPLVADWNGDGAPDLLVGDGNGSVMLFRGSGKEGVPVLAEGVALVPDLPEDRHDEVLCGLDPATGRLILPPLDRPSIRTKVAVADWNGDGKLDLLVGDAFSARGPEPVLTDAQKEERKALEKESESIGREISKRFTDTEKRAEKELGKSLDGLEFSERRRRVSEKADEYLDTDEVYRELGERSEAVWKRLKPLQADHSLHGFVWVYLRTGDPKTAAAEPAASASDSSEAKLVLTVVAKETGKPLRSVRVSLQPKDSKDGFSWSDSKKSKGTIHESLKPDVSGSAEFTVPPREDFRLSAEDPGDFTPRASMEIPALTPGERREVRVEVVTQADLVLCGRLVHEDDRAPVAGAHVRMLRSRSSWTSVDDESPHREWSVVTLSEAVSGPDGTFRLTGESWKSPHVRVEADGFAPRSVVPSAGSDTPEKAMEIRLETCGQLDARVLDAAGKPLPGVSVSLRARGYEMTSHGDDHMLGSGAFELPDEEWKAESGADGTCSLKGLAPRTKLDLELQKDGRVLRKEPDGFEVSPGEVRKMEWRIGSGCTLQGLAVDQSDAPVAGQRILMTRESGMGYFQGYEGDVVASTTTDAGGRFTFEDVPPGTCWIGPAARRYGEDAREDDVAPLAQKVEVAEARTQEVLLKAFRGRFIEGKVVAPDGGRFPEKPVMVEAIPANDEEEWIATTTNAAEDGSFKLGPLGPGPFRLIARHWEVYAPSDPVAADVGAKDVVLSLRAGGFLRGTVVDASTGEPCDAEITVAAEHPRHEKVGFGSMFSTTTRPGGIFDRGGLEPDTYRLSARTRDGRFGILPSVNVSSDGKAEPFVLRVSPGGKLRLHYEGKEPRIVVSFATQGVDVSFFTPVEPGSPTERPAPAGRVVLKIFRGDSKEPRTMEIDVVAGETRDVELRDEG